MPRILINSPQRCAIQLLTSIPTVDIHTALGASTIDQAVLNQIAVLNDLRSAALIPGTPAVLSMGESISQDMIFYGSISTRTHRYYAIPMVEYLRCV